MARVTSEANVKRVLGELDKLAHSAEYMKNAAGNIGTCKYHEGEEDAYRQARLTVVGMLEFTSLNGEEIC